METRPGATPSAAGAIHHDRFKELRRLFVLAMYFHQQIDPNHASGFITRVQELLVSLGDLDPAIAAWRARRHWPHEANPEITMVDALPEIRLRMVAERIPGDVYAATEIAAQMLNRLQPQRFRAGFHDIVKAIACKDARVDALARRLGDVAWYERAHEMRTEWTHYSASFIAPDSAGHPIFVLRGYRGKSNRKHFSAQTELSAHDIGVAGWEAARAMDDLAAHVVRDIVVPTVDRNATVLRPTRDDRGLPVIRGGLFKPETVTFGQVLKELGLDGAV